MDNITEYEIYYFNDGQAIPPTLAPLRHAWKRGGGCGWDSYDNTGMMLNILHINKKNYDKDILHDLSVHWNDTVRFTVASKKHCPKLPVSIIDNLSQDSRGAVRREIAQRNDISEDIFERLSNDNMQLIRCAIAANSNCPKHILEKLSRDVITAVRRSVAANKNTSPEILHMLIADTSRIVRKRVIHNPSTLVETLDKGAITCTSRENLNSLRNCGRLSEHTQFYLNLQS